MRGDTVGSSPSASRRTPSCDGDGLLVMKGTDPRAELASGNELLEGAPRRSQCCHTGGTNVDTCPASPSRGCPPGGRNKECGAGRDKDLSKQLGRVNPSQACLTPQFPSPMPSHLSYLTNHRKPWMWRPTPGVTDKGKKKKPCQVVKQEQKLISGLTWEIASDISRNKVGSFGERRTSVSHLLDA